MTAHVNDVRVVVVCFFDVTKLHPSVITRFQNHENDSLQVTR